MENASKGKKELNEEIGRVEIWGRDCNGKI